MKTALTGEICAVRVEVNNQTNLDWNALKVTPKQTFASLFESICQASEKGMPGARFKEPKSLKADTYISCSLYSSATAPRDSGVEVGWSLSIVECVDSFKNNHVLFSVSHIRNEKEIEKASAFTKLFEGQRELQKKSLKYPAQFGQDPVTKGDWHLKNNFITKILEPEVFGFLNGEEGTIGRTITNDVCDCLFYIIHHLKSLQARSY